MTDALRSKSYLRLFARSKLFPSVKMEELPAALRAKRAGGVSPDELEELIARISWPASTGKEKHVHGMSLPEGPFGVLMPRKHLGTMGRMTLFDTPWETYAGIVTAFRCNTSQSEDVFRWLEFADEDAFVRFIDSGADAIENQTPSMDAIQPIVSRAVRLLWRSLDPTTEQNASDRLADGFRRRGGFSIASVIADDLGIPKPMFGAAAISHDVGPLLGLSQDLDPVQFVAELSKLCSPMSTADALANLAAVRWESVADRAVDDDYHLDRSVAGLRIAGNFPLRMSSKTSLKTIYEDSNALSCIDGVSEGDASIDSVSANRMLEHSQYGVTLLVQMAAEHHPELAKPSMLCNPDAVRILAPIIPQANLKRWLTKRLCSSRFNRNNIEMILLVIPCIESLKVDHLIQAAENNLVEIVQSMLAQQAFPPRQQEKALGAALEREAFAVASLLKDGVLVL